MRSKQVFECPICGKICSNKGMLVWHIRKKHKLTAKEEEELNWARLLVREPEREIKPEEEDFIYISKNKKAKHVLTPIFCRGCGELIAMLEILQTPSQFKERYGSQCRNCGRELGPIFKVRKPKV